MNAPSCIFQGFSIYRNKALIGWLALCYSASFSAVFIPSDGLCCRDNSAMPA
jgi:hypothetical protein